MDEDSSEVEAEATSDVVGETDRQDGDGDEVDERISVSAEDREQTSYALCATTLTVPLSWRSTVEVSIKILQPEISCDNIVS